MPKTIGVIVVTETDRQTDRQTDKGLTSCSTQPEVSEVTTRDIMQYRTTYW